MTSTPLRDRLVQAGVDLLEEEGLGNLTLRAITRRTGVSHGAPRRYFPTHNALLAAIAATGLADLAGLDEAVAQWSAGHVDIVCADRPLCTSSVWPGAWLRCSP